MDLVEQVYRVTRAFPTNESYGLISQMRRCAVSVPSNIAEGSGRGSKKEFVQFLCIAYASLCELETQWLIAGRLHYVSEKESSVINSQIPSVGRMLKALQRSLK